MQREEGESGTKEVQEERVVLFFEENYKERKQKVALKKVKKRVWYYFSRKNEKREIRKWD